MSTLSTDKYESLKSTQALTSIMEFGETIKNPAYRIPQTEYSGCLDISAHA